MSEQSDSTIEFRCSSCSKRLRAKSKSAGRQFVCPKCGQQITVPSPPDVDPNAPLPVEAPEPLPPPAAASDDFSSSPATEVLSTEGAPPKSVFDVDELRLEEFPIEDLEQRHRSAQAIRDEKDALRRQRQAVSKRRQQPTEPQASPTPSHSRQQSSRDRFQDSYTFVDSPKGSLPNEPLTSATPKGSLFDDDLPQLLESPSLPAARSTGDSPPPINKSPGSSSEPDPEFPELNRLHVNPQALQGALEETPVEIQYRATCPTCGTIQYVDAKAQGSQTKCPDCLSLFTVGPPPPNWKPTPAAARIKELDLASPLGEDAPIREIDRRSSERTEQMLRKAESELDTENRETRDYGSDFDTAGFLRQTFGFVTDPVALGFVLGYGLVFALVFAMVQYGLNADDGSWGRGATMFCLVIGPLIGILFALPLFSAALAQLEAVANRLSRVVEWPGLNLYDNMADILCVATAMLAAVMPGYLLGLWLGGDLSGSGRIQIAGVMVSSLLLFPVFLLSILDNGSLFRLVSTDVLRSIRLASEAWAGFYLKTSILFALTMILWLVLLGAGKPPLWAGMAGSMLPGLVFFTFHQLGILADAIGEHLSFSFPTPATEEEDEAPVNQE